MTTPAPAPRSPVLCSPWASLGDVPEAHRASVTEADLMRASEILWMLSGRRWYGVGCTETVTLRSMPPGAGRGAWPYHSSWGRCDCWRYADIRDGWLYPAALDRFHPHYSPYAVQLPRDTVTAIVSVTIDSVPFTEYRLLRSGWVERTDGQSWPVCGDITEITYEYGEAPPEGGVQAVVDLAVQLMLDREDPNVCQLPQRVTSVTRQGISMSVLDPQDFLDQGRVGLYSVDLWLAAVNPYRRGQRGRVWSPDLPATQRQRS